MSNFLRAASFAVFMFAMWFPRLGVTTNYSKANTMIGMLLLAILFALWEISERIKEAS